MTTDSDITPDGIPRPVEGPAAATAGRRRRTRWDRPKPPKDWRYWVGGTGRVLMAIGILMFGFVAYQLWGTGIEYRQSQNSLEREFDRRQADLLVVTDTATTIPRGPSATSVPPGTTRPAGGARATTTPATTTTPAAATTLPPIPWPAVQLGDVIAFVEIPKIHQTVYVVAGIRTADLKRGIGHYPDTPLPGQFGNVAFAGHRTTYGAPLFDVDQLVAGDEVVVTTLTNQRYVYRMVGEPLIVSPRDYQVIRDSDPTKATLTITSCHPRYSAKKRIVVHAELDTAKSGPVLLGTPYYGQTVDASALDPDETDDSVVLPADGETSSEPLEVQIDATQYEGAESLSRGWFSDSGAWLQVALWGVAGLLVILAGYVLDRSVRRYWPGFVLAAVPFVVVLYFLYQNVNRLLPPDL